MISQCKSWTSSWGSWAANIYMIYIGCSTGSTDARWYWRRILQKWPLWLCVFFPWTFSLCLMTMMIHLSSTRPAHCPPCTLASSGRPRLRLTAGSPPSRPPTPPSTPSHSASSLCPRLLPSSSAASAQLILLAFHPRSGVWQMWLCLPKHIKPYKKDLTFCGRSLVCWGAV